MLPELALRNIQSLPPTFNINYHFTPRSSQKCSTIAKTVSFLIITPSDWGSDVMDGWNALLTNLGVYRPLREYRLKFRDVAEVARLIPYAKPRRQTNV